MGIICIGPQAVCLTLDIMAIYPLGESEGHITAMLRILKVYS